MKVSKTIEKNSLQSSLKSCPLLGKSATVNFYKQFCFLQETPVVDMEKHLLYQGYQQRIETAKTT